MTASRIRRSRSFRSGSGISLKVLTTSGVSQVSGQRVQSQPPAGRQGNSAGIAPGPALVYPGGDNRLIHRVEHGAIGRPQLQVRALSQLVVGRQPFFTRARIPADTQG